MKLLTVILFLLLYTFTHAQDTINQLDSDRKKTGYWRITGDMRKLPDYNKNQLYEEGYYNKNRKIGTWKKYWPNGNLKSEIEYKNGRASGIYATYDESGKLEEKGDFKNQYNFRWTSDCGTYWNVSEEKTFTPPKDSLQQKTVILIPKPPLQEENINGYQKIYNENRDILLDGEFKTGHLINGNHYIYDGYGLLSFINKYTNGEYISRGTIAPKK